MVNRSRTNRRASKANRPQSPVAQGLTGLIRSLDRTFFFRAALIIFTGLWIFWPTLHGDWISDDNFYIVENPLLQDPDRLWKAWFVPGSFIEYYPIHQSVQFALWNVCGKDPFGYHLTNILLHIVSGLLVWRLLSKLGLQLAWLGGLLFVLHPVQIESVAWISELKNTLSLPPFLLAMCYWIDYEDHKKVRDYRLALGWFLVAMLCKVTMSPFPVVILLYAWWKRSQVDGNDLRDSMPFFVISLVLGSLTILSGSWFGNHHLQAPDSAPIGNWLSRLALVSTTTTFYLSKCFWPIWPLSVYPQWSVDPPGLLQLLPLLFLLIITILLWRKRNDWGKHVLLALGFFIIVIAPFLGFTTVSFMKATWVYDHFLYIPIIGLIGIAIAALEKLRKMFPLSIRIYGYGITMMILSFLAIISHNYAKLWVNEEALCIDAVKGNPSSSFVHNNLGYFMEKQRRFSDAIYQYREALRIKPDYALAHYNLGNALIKSGDTVEAISHFKEAMKIYPDYDLAYNNLGYALLQMGHTSEASQYFQHALKISPDFAEAHNGLANTYQIQGHFLESVAEYKESLRLSPNNALTHDNLGFTYGKMGRTSEAIHEFEAALKIDPQDSTASSLLTRLQTVPTISNP